MLGAGATTDGNEGWRHVCAFASDAGSGRNDGGIESRRYQRVVTRHSWRGRNQSCAEIRRGDGLIARQPKGRERLPIRREQRCGYSRESTFGAGATNVDVSVGAVRVEAQSLRRRRPDSAGRLKGSRPHRARTEVSKLGASTTFGTRELPRAIFNGLHAVLRLAATGASSVSSLRAAEIFSARKFVAAVID